MLSRLDDLDFQELARSELARDVDQSTTATTRRLHIGIALGRPLDEYFQAPPYAGSVAFVGDVVLQGHQTIEPVLQNVMRHLLRVRSRWSTGSGRILKGESRIELSTCNDIEGRFEITLRFPGKANDDVRGGRRGLE